MLRLSRRALAPLALPLLALPALAAPRAQHVVIVSLDGGKPAVIQQSRMPVLMSMVQSGATTWTARTTLPSVTLIAHTSMLTGVKPSKHHIDWDDYQPKKGIVQVPTVFELAKQRGLTTALFAGKKKFRHLERPGSLDMSYIKTSDALPIAKVAAKTIKQARPSLCFVHFPDTDGAGHKYGWGSPEQMQAFADEDKALGILQKAIQEAGIAQSTVVIVTADHGGHRKVHGGKSDDDMNIPWVASGAGVRRGYALRGPVSTWDTTATALWLLDVPLPKSLDGKPVVEAFTGPAARVR